MRRDYWAVKGDMQGTKAYGCKQRRGLSVWFKVKGDICGHGLLHVVINIGMDHLINKTQ